MENSSPIGYNTGMPVEIQKPKIDLAALCLDLEEATGYTPIQMAEYLDTEARSYYRWRSGEREPNGQYTAKLFLLLRETETRTSNKIPLKLK